MLKCLDELEFEYKPNLELNVFFVDFRWKDIKSSTSEYLNHKVERTYTAFNRTLIFLAQCPRWREGFGTEIPSRNFFLEPSLTQIFSDFKFITKQNK